jgi:hypothetical protein
MLHAPPDVERHLNTRHSGGTCQAHRVLEQRLLAPNHYQEGRQPGEVGLKRGGQWRARVGTMEVLSRHALQAGLGRREVRRGIRLERLSGAS